ncbi:patatin-like protein 7 [Cinnamomum micranthum f. kanehirae]|uniref:Patatin n=1 Tax=Cinnamomum micranthum f. kanehirae TaxID=337451 RepID=A0A3S3N5L2_9MAGN|nr:patatin-like protein 7 [Cinnamomum micranthum f. kanehirae]
MLLKDPLFSSIPSSLPSFIFSKISTVTENSSRPSTSTSSATRSSPSSRAASSSATAPTPTPSSSSTGIPLLSSPQPLNPPKTLPGKVRILSIDSGGATDGILSARSLALLEDSLRRTSHNPDARIADYFDVVSGSGAGGVLAALLFTRGDDGRPLLSAAEAQRFLEAGQWRSIPADIRRPRVEEERVYKKLFSENTLKDTLKTVLVPCYDLASNAPFLFSRADALETDGYDFRMREVCFATSADPTTVGAIEMRSVDGRTRIVAVDGGVAMSNPTAAAITHVLNNKQEFPFCRGVEDLLVVSLGNGESGSVRLSRRSSTPSAGEFVRIAGDGVSDMVDQAVSMSFGHCRASNYVRIQANGFRGKKFGSAKYSNSSKAKKVLDFADEMLAQKNMESILFQGKRISEKTNAEKLEWFAGELVKEQERRKSSVFPTVVLKQATPRTSSVTLTSSSG